MTTTGLQEAKPVPSLPRSLVFLVFFASGVAALIYQLVWQRSLLMIFGSNIESIAIVVSAFLVGLGIGSLIGGFLSKRENFPLLTTFGFLELGIAAYGLASLSLFSAASGIAVHASLATTAITTFLLILIPTLLMGATLPLLAAHFIQKDANVGNAVSWLYFVNTLGAAAGAFFTAFYVLQIHGLQGSIHIAAAFNIVAGIIILLATRFCTQK